MKTVIKYLILAVLFLGINVSVYAQDKLEQGINAVKKGDYVSGLNILKDVVKSDKSYEANYYYGKALLETGSLTEAERHFKAALSDNDEGVEAYIGLGDIANRKKQYALATSYYKQGVKADNEAVAPLVALGINLSQGGNLDSALIILTRATTLNDRDPNIYRALGDVYFYGRAFPAALQNYQKSISLRNNAGAHFGIGRVNYYQKNYQEALNSYQEAVKADQNFADAYFELGRLLLYNEDYPASEKAFQRYGQLTPGSQLGKIYLARVQIEQEKYDDAIIQLNDALKIEPNNTSAFKYLGYAYRGKEDFPKAIEFFEKVPAADLESEDFVILAGIYAGNKDMSKSYDAFNKAISLDSAESSIYYELGKIQFNNNEYEPAIVSLDKAISMGSRQLAAHVYKGIAYYQLKKYDEAIQAFDQAISLDATFAFSYLWKGRALIALNRKDEAITAYNKVLELEPDNEDAKNDLKLLQGSGSNE